MASDKPVSMFHGLSTLRAEERKKDAATKTQNTAMQEYLKRYTSGDTGEQDGEKKKKKKKKPAVGTSAGAIRIIDEDIQGQAQLRKPPSSFSDEEEDDEYKPVIANEAEAKLFIKQNRQAKEFYKAREDGSGWTNVSDQPLGQRTRHDSPDASPPRRGAARHDSPDASPPRRKARHDSPDASPPRRGAARHDSPDASPPRRKARHDSPDASPPRKSGRPVSKNGHAMADGTATGLVSAKQLQSEMEHIKQQAAERRSAAVGRHAETVYRDKKTGAIVSKSEFEEERSKIGRDGKKIKSKDDTIQEHVEWKSGLAQRRAAEEVAARLAQEAAAPFARYENDRERDALLKSRSRFGDPMAHLVRDRGGEEPAALTSQYDASRLQESGFIIPQGIPSHSWLKRGVAAPANRYNIRPGRHWDGVDRSNGFEREMFKHQATVKHREEQARLWSMSDL